MQTNHQTILTRLTEEEHQFIQALRQRENRTFQPTTVHTLWAEILAKGKTTRVLDAPEAEILALIQQYNYHQYLAGLAAGKGQDVVVG